MSLRSRANVQDEKQESEGLPIDQGKSTVKKFEATDRRGTGSESQLYYNNNMESQSERGDDIGIGTKEERMKPSGISAANRGVIYSTHFNIFMYSTCFWIQTGTLPVSSIYIYIYIYMYVLFYTCAWIDFV